MHFTFRRSFEKLNSKKKKKKQTYFYKPSVNILRDVVNQGFGILAYGLQTLSMCYSEELSPLRATIAEDQRLQDHY